MHHDQYSAYVVVCGRDAGFSGDVTSTFLNLDPEGGLTQHLPIQLAMLPALFTVSVLTLALVAPFVADQWQFFRGCVQCRVLSSVCNAMSSRVSLIVFVGRLAGAGLLEGTTL